MEKKNYPGAKFVKKIINRLPGSLKRSIIGSFPYFYSGIESRLKLTKDVELHLLKALCDPTKTTLDIGVLWGAYTYRMREYSKEVICFEPNPNMAAHLRKAFKEKVTVHNVAASDHAQKLRLRVPTGRPGNATVEDSNVLKQAKNLMEFDVDGVTIDSFSLKNVGFAKIDVEGHEQSVFMGMTELLQHERPNILVEIEERHKKGAIADATNFLTPLGYGLYFIKGNKILPVAQLTANDTDVSNRGTWKYIKNFIGLHDSNRELVFSDLERHFGISGDN